MFLRYFFVFFEDKLKYSLLNRIVYKTPLLLEWLPLFEVIVTFISTLVIVLSNWRTRNKRRHSRCLIHRKRTLTMSNDPSSKVKVHVRKCMCKIIIKYTLRNSSDCTDQYKMKFYDHFNWIFFSSWCWITMKEW